MRPEPLNNAGFTEHVHAAREGYHRIAPFEFGKTNGTRGLMRVVFALVRRGRASRPGRASFQCWERDAGESGDLFRRKRVRDNHGDWRWDACTRIPAKRDPLQICHGY